jgi:hypothetical protein
MDEGQDQIGIEEQELQEQERALFQMEEELHERELAFLEHEEGLLQKYRALLAFADYVREEEAALERRAGNIGVVALENVRGVLATQPMPEVPSLTLGVEADARLALLERRRELYAQRLEMIDAREQLIALRHDSVEQLLASAGDVEASLLDRQRLVGEAARQVFMGAAADGPRTSRAATAPVAAMPRSPLARTPSSPDATAPFSAQTPPDDSPSQARPRNQRTPVKVTLEVPLDAPAGSTFFTDEQNLDGDLPGFFLATPNLLKVGREVKVRMMRGTARIEVSGRVAWIRERGRSEGPPGMGLQFFDLGSAERDRIAVWSRELPSVPLNHLNKN